jgi:hypothetical protein
MTLWVNLVGREGAWKVFSVICETKTLRAPPREAWDGARAWSEFQPRFVEPEDAKTATLYETANRLRKESRGPVQVLLGSISLN